MGFRALYLELRASWPMCCWRAVLLQSTGPILLCSCYHHTAVVLVAYMARGPIPSCRCFYCMLCVRSLCGPLLCKVAVDHGSTEVLPYMPSTNVKFDRRTGRQCSSGRGLHPHYHARLHRRSLVQLSPITCIIIVIMCNLINVFAMSLAIFAGLSGCATQLMGRVGPEHPLPISRLDRSTITIRVNGQTLHVHVLQESPLLFKNHPPEKAVISTGAAVFLIVIVVDTPPTAPPLPRLR